MTLFIQPEDNWFSILEVFFKNLYPLIIHFYVRIKYIMLDFVNILKNMILFYFIYFYSFIILCLICCPSDE